jgi:hypothetical protein
MRLISETDRREIQDINWSRKSCQVSAGDVLRRLEQSWVGLISKNYEIEQACLELEAEKYERSAEKAQLQFILSEAKAERSGRARGRRRIRRFNLQQQRGRGQVKGEGRVTQEVTGEGPPEETQLTAQMEFPDSDKIANDPENESDESMSE